MIRRRKNFFRPKAAEPEILANERIKVREVRVVGAAGENLGVMSTEEAIKKAIMAANPCRGFEIFMICQIFFTFILYTIANFDSYALGAVATVGISDGNIGWRRRSGRCRRWRFCRCYGYSRCRRNGWTSAFVRKQYHSSDNDHDNCNKPFYHNLNMLFIF